jgi:hypothetical protein
VLAVANNHLPQVTKRFLGLLLGACAGKHNNIFSRANVSGTASEVWIRGKTSLQDNK